MGFCTNFIGSCPALNYAGIYEKLCELFDGFWHVKESDDLKGFIDNLKLFGYLNGEGIAKWRKLLRWLLQINPQITDNNIELHFCTEDNDHYIMGLFDGDFKILMMHRKFYRIYDFSTLENCCSGYEDACVCDCKCTTDKCNCTKDCKCPDIEISFNEDQYKRDFLWNTKEVINYRRQRAMCTDVLKNKYWSGVRNDGNDGNDESDLMQDILQLYY